MSDFLHEPEDRFKALIDDVFVEKQKEKKKGPTKRIQLPNAPSVFEEEEFLVEQGLLEMESIRQSFLDFQEVISDSAVYPYLFPHIEQFADIAQDLIDLISNDIDTEELSDSGLVDYERLQEVRNRILDQINKKYKG